MGSAFGRANIRFTDRNYQILIEQILPNHYFDITKLLRVTNL